jgi:hypothetical protein
VVSQVDFRCTKVGILKLFAETGRPGSFGDKPLTIELMCRTFKAAKTDSICQINLNCGQRWHHELRNL